GSDVKHGVADPFGRAARDLFVAQDAQAERVHQRIAFIAFVEVDLAPYGWDAEAIAVMRDAAYHAGEEALVIFDLRFAICDFGARTFGSDGLAFGLGAPLTLPSPFIR